LLGKKLLLNWPTCMIKILSTFQSDVAIWKQEKLLSKDVLL
jgi:hypothetical protein